MNRFLIIPFEFCKKTYYSLVMCKSKAEGTEYRITVMNGELEQLLFGNNVILEKNGTLHLEVSQNELQESLKMQIAESLVKVLKIPINTMTANK